MNKFFDLMPYDFKNTGISILGISKYRKKYGSDYSRHLNFLLHSQEREKEQLASTLLCEFLDKLSEKKSAYLVPDTLNVHDMPIIQKSDILQNYNSYTLEKPYIIKKSSGTTGQPLAIPYNRTAYQHEYAYWWYHRGYEGIEPGSKVATFAGHKVAYINRKTPPFWAYNWYENQLIFSSYHLSKENIQYYINELNRFKPELIHGYPSSIFLIARYIQENDVLLEFSPKMVICGSETLLDIHRSTIENAFNCKVYLWYGNTELCGHITECPYSRLHSHPLHSYIRVVDFSGSDVKPGQEGSIVATNFTNTVFPLINYNTGDRVILSKNQSCRCGRAGLMFDRVIGRMEQYVLTNDGRWIGRLDHLFKDAKYIANAQLEQRKQGSLIIRIEKLPRYTTEIEHTITREALARLGSDIDLAFEYVDEIPKNSNGKFDFVIQKINLGR